MRLSKQFPFRMSLMNATVIPTQMNDSINLFLMLNGSISISTPDQEYLLHTDDLLVINPFQQYKIVGTEKNLFLYLQISREQMAQHVSLTELPFFDCCTLDSSETKLEQFKKLRETLARLMVAYFKKNEETDLEVYQYLFTLLTCLIKEFKKITTSAHPLSVTTTDEKINAIIEHIQKNYDEPISLEQLAKAADLSYYHLSRLFKKQVGVTFTEYQNQIKLIHATEELLLTDHAIVKIALNNGFASVKHFHQVFKKKYGLTPSVYRKEHSSDRSLLTNTDDAADFQELSGTIALQELAKYLVENDIDDESVVIKQELSLAIPNTAQPEYRQTKKIIKIGQAFEGLSNTVQRELNSLQKESHFDLIQFTGFCEESNFESDVHLISEYIRNNQWFDFLVQIQLKPMIQLIPPEQLLQRNEMQVWCDRQLKMLRHFLNRYGYEEMNQWFLEWHLSDPDNEQQKGANYWGYNYFYRKLKQLIPQCTIGFQSLISLDEQTYSSYCEFLLLQKNQHCLPGFISFQADPYDSQQIKKEHSLYFKEYQQNILNRVLAGISLIQSEEKDIDWRPEIYLTNWNTLVGEGDTLAGTFFRSALILESIIELSEQISGMAFWLNIKVKERQTHRREDSSLSVFLYEELRRPLFFSLSFLDRMSGQLISKGDGYLLTQHNNHYQLLLYNSSYLDPVYSVDSYQVQYQSKKMAVHLKNMPAGDYLLRHYVLDKDHGGIYNDWIRVGGQTEIDLELLTYLTQKIMPKFELSRESVSPEGFTLDSTLTLNACHLYVFQPIY
ncbi:helix-turn-helix domain-containing protein [Enterococcus sp. BWR-S5]|uniref:helix-turn-helix domain-containing protein n=1 Tax=Enterococcus sp. BWR-S5 TaxID=2787714 RepID=UPI001921B5E7|nr:helix-turn-helix domain-containing protein [Enterococcus sp. BWR-S5]MBL1225501.1 helix-turn-helix domain-containing protein [Enterococcus sp. BWR-S5]